MSLLRLSNELLLEIISYLKGSCESISRSSRRLHEITEHVLYSSVTLDQPKSYPRYIHTIVRNPRLAGYARHFRTVGHPYGWNFDLSFLTHEDRAWIWNQLPRLAHGKSACNDWFKKMFLSPETDWLEVPMTWDAIVALLLTLFAGSLRTIRIDSYGWNAKDYRFIKMVLLSSVKFPDRFQHLQKVTLMGCLDEEYGAGLSALPAHFVIPFLQVPSVAEFGTSNLSLVRIPSKSAFRINDLISKDHRLTGNSLMSFLLCFSSLKRLRFHLDHTRDARQDASYVRRGLAASKDTLEELILIHAPGESDSWTGDESSTSDGEEDLAFNDKTDIEKIKPDDLGPLRSFEKLKILHLESTLIRPLQTRPHSHQYGSDSLNFLIRESDRLALADYFPASLERLILNMPPSIHCHLLDLLSTGTFLSNTPNLKSILLLLRHNCMPDGKPLRPDVARLSELQYLARMEGVDLSWDCMCELGTPFQCYEASVKE